jgi:hypothetical protein
MKQREHEALDRFTMLNKPSPPEGAVQLPPQRVKLPKHTNGATCVLAFFAIAAGKRISEKNPAFSSLNDQNGPMPPI